MTSKPTEGTTPAGRWFYRAGSYGCVVTLRETAIGGPLVLDHTDPDTGRRVQPYAESAETVRSKRGTVDKGLRRLLVQEAEAKSADVRVRRLNRLREDVKPNRLTVGEGFALFFDPQRRALPRSRQARLNYALSRRFWCAALGPDTPWSRVKPADVWGALLGLKEHGRVASAEKRLRNLRTIHRWLTGPMDMDSLRDPTRGLTTKALTAGYTPKRPRVTAAERKVVRNVAGRLPWRLRLCFALLMSSGTRIFQARSAMRSGLDAPLEPPPPPGVAPLGWIALPAVKGQRPHVTFFTLRQRLEVARAIGRTWDGERWMDGPLAGWEAEYRAGQRNDYALIPGGNPGRLTPSRPISDNGVRKYLASVFEDAGISKRERMGFHAFRRAWADVTNRAIGLKAVKAGGGWSREETAEGYIDPFQPELLDEVRELMEMEEG